MYENWLYYAGSFFLTAQLACQEILDPKGHIKSINSRFHFNYSEQDLGWAIMFNLKHGIELYIKTLRILINLPTQNSHDIKKLFDEFEKEMNKMSFQACKINGDEIKKEDIQEIPAKISKIKNLINKYYTLKILNYNIEDKMNDACRFPDNKVNLDIEPDNFTDEILKEILTDIGDFKKLLGELGYLLRIHQKCNP